MVMKYKNDMPISLGIKELPPEDRPRERLEKNGVAALSDLELLAVLIGSGNKERPVQVLARELLQILDRTASSIDLADLKSIKGLGTAKAALICAALEIGRRRLPTKRRQISSPNDVFPLIQHYGDRRQEQFLSIALNGAHEVMSVSVVSVGLVNRTLVHPREVFADAVGQRATAVIVAHNHPSGNLQPSGEDLEVTKRLRNAGDILGIKVLDHLIFDQEHFYSLLEGGEF
jgi:DNA repair protein RadC